jgi:antitoxin (DNA-binding transcriptional repressor) of toxin-antitoxin stability system
MKVPIREVKSNLSKFGDMAHAGQRIIVSKNGKPWFELVPHQRKSRCIKPIEGIRATVTTEAAIAPVDARDIEGWI